MSFRDLLGLGARPGVGARTLIRQLLRGDPTLPASHPFKWLLSLCHTRVSLVGEILGPFMLNRLMDEVRDTVRTVHACLPLDEHRLADRACVWAAMCGREQAGERDVASAILELAGYPIPGLPKTVKDMLDSPLPSVGGKLPDELAASLGLAFPPPPTPMLDLLGRSLTRAAAKGRVGPIAGRGREIDAVIQILGGGAKPNPLLVCPAGVGPETVVEGLAWRLAGRGAGEMPRLLQDASLVSLPVSLMASGPGSVSDFEERMEFIRKEAARPGTILFLDEIHTTVGRDAPGAPSATPGIAGLLEPDLARGSLACIAATTEGEYGRAIEHDPALERWFTPIQVPGLSATQSLDVLRRLRDDLGRAHPGQVALGDDTLAWMVDFAGRELPNQAFPDKAVLVFEQVVADARALGAQTIELARAQEVARRMVGPSLFAEDRFGGFAKAAAQASLLPKKALTALLARFDTAFRRQSVRRARPNAVVLLAGRASKQARKFATLAAHTLYGGPERLIRVDLSRYSDFAGLAAFLKSDPGLPGRGRPTRKTPSPLARLEGMPWCVLFLDRATEGHPILLDLLARSLERGYVTNALGRRIYLTHAVVIVAAAASSRAGLARTLGERFIAQADVLATSLAPRSRARRP